MGISQIPAFRIDSLGLDFALAQNMYFLALGFLVLGIYACRALEKSRTGRAYVAVRENPELAHEIENKVRESLGIPLLPDADFATADDEADKG
jgi:hypothetical protein